MNPLDFIETPKGAIALITEKNYPTSEGMPCTYSIEFLGGGNPTGEKNSWWQESQLKVVDNLPSLLARNLIHPFGKGKQPALDKFPIIKD